MPGHLIMLGPSGPFDQHCLYLHGQLSVSCFSCADRPGRLPESRSDQTFSKCVSWVTSRAMAYLALPELLQMFFFFLRMVPRQFFFSEE